MGIISPDEFAEKMRELIAKYTYDVPLLDSLTPYFDPEECHPEMDELMCKMLTQLGYAEGVDIFRNTKKWYA